MTGNSLRQRWENAMTRATGWTVRVHRDTLPGREYGDIAIAPFAVQDESGNRWGLIDETVGYGFPHAELHPNRLGFNPPWNGDYDT